MMALKCIKVKLIGVILFSIILFFSGCFILTKANAQERDVNLKKYVFKDSLISNLVLQEIQRFKKEDNKDYIVLNYNGVKKQFKIALMDQFEFCENIFLYRNIVIGVSMVKGKTFGFLGDSEEFLESTNAYIKVIDFKDYSKRIERNRMRLAKKQGLINFPKHSDSYSLFYRFDNKSLIYLNRDMISVFSNEWK